jgi:hypothetical protein
MLTGMLIAITGPMLTLVPVLAIVFLPRRARAPVAIRIDGRHYRNAPGTIEHEGAAKHMMRECRKDTSQERSSPLGGGEGGHGARGA